MCFVLKEKINDFKNLRIEVIFFLVMIIFGCFSTFLTYPLSNGDEGYHLSKAYEVFSLEKPFSMSEEILRGYELQAISGNGIDINDFNYSILEDVKNDEITFKVTKNNNCILNVDLFHFPAAIVVLLARLIYPSYGFMLCLSRLSNLLFYAVSCSILIKYSKVAKVSLFMLFSIPFLQKIASPSYDVYSYVAFFAFVVNLFNISKLKSIKDITKKQNIYTLFTVIMILFAKTNYIFSLFGLLILMINIFLKNINKRTQYLLIFISIICLGIIIIVMNDIFDLKNYIRVFFDSFLNMATSGRKGRELFSVVPAILPDIFNIIWFIILFLVIASETKYQWDKFIVYGFSTVFFVNWIGIYSAYYLMHNRPISAISEIGGRYLHPFLLFFTPMVQNIGYKYDIRLPKKNIKTIAVMITVIIMILYVITVYYRGYIIHTIPTWNM